MDLPTILSTQPAITAATPAVIAVPAAVVSVPENIAILARMLETQGQASLSPSTTNTTPSANLLTLTTPMGQITLSLPNSAETEAQLTTLRDLIAQQKPLPLFVQPGSPPTAAFLMLPQPTNQKPAASAITAQAPVATDTSITPPIQIPSQNFVAGMTIKAAIIQTLPPSVAPALPDTRTPLAQSGTPTGMTPGNVGSGNTPPPITPLAAATTQASSPQPSVTLLPSGLSTSDVLARFQTNAGTAPQPAQLTLFTKLPSNNPANPIPLPETRGSSPSVATMIGTTRDGFDVIQIDRSIVSTAIHLNEPQGTRFLAMLTLPPAAPQTVPPQQSKTVLMMADPVVADTPDLAKAYQVLFAGPADEMAFDEGDWLARTIETLTQVPANTLPPNAVLAQLPKANAALPASLMFFLSALQSGGELGWIPSSGLDAMIRKNKAFSPLKQIRDHLKTPPTAQDTQGETWQRHSVPVLHEGQWHFLHISIQDRQHTPQHNSSASDTPRVRFLVDLRMTKLGALQLDGLSHQKRLDLMIRSEARLPDPLTDSLQAQFCQTLQALGMHGVLSVEAGRKGWVSFHNRLSRDTLA